MLHVCTWNFKDPHLQNKHVDVPLNRRCQDNGKQTVSIKLWTGRSDVPLSPHRTRLSLILCASPPPGLQWVWDRAASGMCVWPSGGLRRGQWHGHHLGSIVRQQDPGAAGLHRQQDVPSLHFRRLSTKKGLPSYTLHRCVCVCVCMEAYLTLLLPLGSIWPHSMFDVSNKIINIVFWAKYFMTFSNLLGTTVKT